MNDIEMQLMKVQSLQREQRLSLNTINAARYRSLGRKLIPVSDSDRSVLRNKALAFYSDQIQDIYKRINSQLLKENRNPMNNPFRRKEDENNGN